MSVFARTRGQNHFFIRASVNQLSRNPDKKSDSDHLIYRQKTDNFDQNLVLDYADSKNGLTLGRHILSVSLWLFRNERFRLKKLFIYF